MGEGLLHACISSTVDITLPFDYLYIIYSAVDITLPLD